MITKHTQNERSVAWFYVIYVKGRSVENYFDLYPFLFKNLGLAALDLIYIPCGLIASVFPTRFFAMGKEWIKFIKNTVIFGKCMLFDIPKNDKKNVRLSQIVPKNEELWLLLRYDNEFRNHCFNNFTLGFIGMLVYFLFVRYFFFFWFFVRVYVCVCVLFLCFRK